MSREILRFATFEIVYVVIGTIYALCLYKLNRFLVESGIAENYMDVILYKKGISIYFFIDLIDAKPFISPHKCL